jgi:hypothetical protein
MAIIRGKIGNIATLPTTVGAIYTNAASTRTFFKGVTLFNSGEAAETVRLYNVPNSGGSVGTAAATNQFLEIGLASKETFIFEFPGDGAVHENTNETIQGFTTTANTVTYQLHGVKDV